MERAQDLKRSIRIRDRRFEQRSFVRSALAFGIARPGVPGGRHYCLVILDHLVFALYPMSK
jgi:hypothetical protein